MKILIVPFILHPKSDAAYYLTQDLAALLSSDGDIVAVSADNENAFHYASTYSAPKPRKAMFRHKKENRSYEEWMYNHGALDTEYLEEDLTNLLNIIDHFHPDRILTMDRLAAVSAGRLKQIPVDAVVNSAMYKVVGFSRQTIKEYNAFLSRNKLEQVLSLKDIYKQCQHRFGFGPVETQPFNFSDNIQRIGIASTYPMEKEPVQRVCIYLADVHKTTLTLRKILSESFLGASYPVYIWYPGCKQEKDQNIHYLTSPRADLIGGSSCLIHDGNSFFMNQCLACGTPQVIIASHEYTRMYNGQAVQRTGVGRYLYEEAMSLSNLYENFRRVVSDDLYKENCQELKEKTTAFGDLNELIDCWKQ